MAARVGPERNPPVAPPDPLAKPPVGADLRSGEAGPYPRKAARRRSRTAAGARNFSAPKRRCLGFEASFTLRSWFRKTPPPAGARQGRAAALRRAFRRYTLGVHLHTKGLNRLPQGVSFRDSPSHRGFQSMTRPMTKGATAHHQPANNHRCVTAPGALTLHS